MVQRHFLNTLYICWITFVIIFSPLFVLTVSMIDAPNPLQYAQHSVAQYASAQFDSTVGVR